REAKIRTARRRIEQTKEGRNEPQGRGRNGKRKARLATTNKANGTNEANEEQRICLIRPIRPIQSRQALRLFERVGVLLVAGLGAGGGSGGGQGGAEAAGRGAFQVRQGEDLLIEELVVLPPRLCGGDAGVDHLIDLDLETGGEVLVQFVGQLVGGLGG